MPSALEWSLAVISTFLRLILCTAIIYFTFRFYKYSSSQALQKRHPLLTYWLSFFVILYIGFQHTFLTFAYIYGVTEPSVDVFISSSDYEKNEFYGSIFRYIALIFYTFSIHGSLIVLISRSWIIYFNINWGLQTEKEKWITHINAQVITSMWFLNHRKNFGSYKKIYIFSISYWLTQALVTLFFAIFVIKIAFAIDLISLIIEIILLIIIWIKIPDFKKHDVFAFKQELKTALIFAFIALIFYIVWIVYWLFFGDGLWSFMIFQFSFALFIGLVAISLLVNIFDKKYEYLILNNYILSNQENNVERSLKNTLNDNELINEFFVHLSHEFSVELLLAFVEFIQFRNVMMNDDEFVINDKDKLNDQIKITLPENLPKSYIVHEKYKHISINVDKYLSIAKNLFDKYIYYGAEFEINISYQCRQNIIGFVNTCCNASNISLNGQQKRQLFLLYDEARVTVYSLMSSSHQRFISRSS
eukprot:250186_1